MKNAYRMPAPHEGLPPALRIDSPALKNPRVSIVVNNYNYGRFLDCSLRSAVEQTNPCEVVVVDDGSTDESAEVLHRWQEKVKVIRQPNSGQIAAYEAGFRASTEIGRAHV